MSSESKQPAHQTSLEPAEFELDPNQESIKRLKAGSYGFQDLPGTLTSVGSVTGEDDSELCDMAVVSDDVEGSSVAVVGLAVVLRLCVRGVSVVMRGRGEVVNNVVIGGGDVV